MKILRFGLKLIVLSWLVLGGICCWWSPALALNGATVAIYNDTGVWSSGLTALESMMTTYGITYEEVTASDLNSSTTNLSSLYETIIIPGGNAGYYNGTYGNANYINATGKTNIQNFVSAGGGYLGICAGAYFASDNVVVGGVDYSSYYTLDLFSGTATGPMNDIANYDIGLSAMATVNFTTTNSVLSSYKSTPYSEDILYYGGPYFTTTDSTVQTLGTYEYNDQAAVVACTYGSGKVVLFGPHPEIEEDSTRDGTTYGDSYDDNGSDWGLLNTALSYLGASATTSTTGSYSRYDFTYNYNNGSGDYYVGYVYAPTSFETSQGGFLSLATVLYDQPEALKASGYTLNGGYYYITAITDGFDSSYDKISYITSYYDADSAKASLSVNSTGSAILSYVNGHILDADRTTSMEYGYAVSGSNVAYFSPLWEADVTASVATAASSSSALTATYTTASADSSSSALTATSTSASAAQSQAVWAAYWSDTPSLLD